MPVPNIDVVAEKVSSPISLSAPAVNTGGRDAMPLRTSVMPGSSSALDLIKKKLQDSGVPFSSPVPVIPVTVAQELNGSRAVDVKDLQSENSKDKLKDANGDGNISDSSSDSEDTDSGPSKEQCFMQFKVYLVLYFVAYSKIWLILVLLLESDFVAGVNLFIMQVKSTGNAQRTGHSTILKMGKGTAKDSV